jgi:U2-associated protein SR140
MLRAMTGKRAEIARAMEFVVGHAECADEVAEMVCGSLKLDGTAVPRKMARLYLVSDVLHNSVSRCSRIALLC